MTTKPEFRLGRQQLPGILAIALFVVIASVALAANFGDAIGFSAAESVTANIGFALFNIPTTIPSDGFLVAFILIALVLDAALDGAVLLARREEEGDMVTAIGEDGGETE